MKSLNFDIEIFTDASRSGWGAYANNIRANGKWKLREQNFHINYLELLAAFFGVKCFANDKSNCTILLRIDNTTAISYINRMGGIQYPHLNSLTKTIWQWCEGKKIWLHASYINTKDNVEADQESRRINPDTEWELTLSGFQKVTRKLGKPDIDLFATRTNAKCELYVSWKRDPEAFAIDSFTLNWNDPTSSYPGSSNALRVAFTKRGSPALALNLILASVSRNTLRQYEITYKLWWKFCEMNNFEPYCTSVTTVLLFLTEQFNKNASYGSLNSHRSALSLLLGDNIGSQESIKRLLKGAYKLRPTVPKYCHTWDPQIVLNFITDWFPNNTLSIEKLTKKLVILLALCTAHRVQTFSLIKIDNIKISQEGVKIIISENIKTSAAGREQPVLYLPYFIENINICPATTLVDYLTMTKNLRSEGCHNLLLTFRVPHRPATSQTISRWIKQILASSGIDVSTFNAHSTRHASTSAAKAAGVSVETIRKTAGWSRSSTTFSKFYHRQ
ncbi:uncharacterized protein LOC131855468, partial [Achroia grisella]|uniref:uncharacterized protein LOC131855468 n=1 Tax=Achroia grisella TaxID=688607 RepID=UPI0027D23D64